VKRGYQWRTLTAGGNIHSPDVSDNRHARIYGELAAITHLETDALVGGMKNGLAMKTASLYRFWVEPVQGQKLVDRLRAKARKCLLDSQYFIQRTFRVRRNIFDV
jgi:hypothetical protein